MIRVLGVDPGSVCVGAAIIERTGDDLLLVRSEHLKVRTRRGESNLGERCCQIRDWIATFMDDIDVAMMEAGLQKARGGQSQITTHEARAPIRMAWHDRTKGELMTMKPSEWRRVIGLHVPARTPGEDIKRLVVEHVVRRFPSYASAQPDEAEAIGIAWAAALTVEEFD